MLAISNPLNESELAFPVLECIHIIGFALSIGTISIVDFCLLGIGMTRQKPSELLKDTSTWTLVGIVIMLFSGLMLFSSDPDMYYLNWAFLIKMACLLLAIVFNYTIHRKIARSDTPPPHSKLVASVSLVLWGSVVFGGIFIAFINEGLT
jgi:hypothetical protein